MIKKIDKHNISFKKATWSEEDDFTARCIGFDFNPPQEYICNIKVTMPDAVKSFISQVMREPIPEFIKPMYFDMAKEFGETIYKNTDFGNIVFRKHQKEAILFNSYRDKYAIFFEQGLGKTYTSWAGSMVTNARRTIVVCPSIAKWNWYEELTEGVGIDMLHVSLLDRDKTKTVFSFDEYYLIVNYEMIERYWNHIVKDNVDHIIVDEVHEAKNVKTRKHKNVQRLFNQFPKSKETILTGTPTTNWSHDFFGYLKLLDHPLGDNYSYFSSRYVKRKNGTKSGKIIGTKNKEELMLRLSNFFIRKKTKECVDLPSLSIDKYILNIEKYSKGYHDLIEEIKQSIRDKKVIQERINDIRNDKSISTKERKYLIAEERKQLFKVKSTAHNNIHSLNRLTGESKVPALIKLIKSMRDKGEKLVLFCPYTSPLEMLKKEFGKHCVLVNGSVNSYKRKKLENKFKTDDSVFLFLGNNIAAGQSINLTNARYGGFISMPFTPKDFEQPLKRIHRMGQDRNCQIFCFVAKKDVNDKSIDDRIYNILLPKFKDIAETIDKGKDVNIKDEGSIEEKLFEELFD